jgi:hypothetical protein
MSASIRLVASAIVICAGGVTMALAERPDRAPSNTYIVGGFVLAAGAIFFLVDYVRPSGSDKT